MKKIAILTFLSVFSVAANSECSPNTCEDVYIEKLYVNASGIIYIGTTGNESLLDCSAESGVYATLDLNQTGSNAIYSTLLAAQMADKKVQVRTQNGSTGCKVLYVTLNRQ